MCHFRCPWNGMFDCHWAEITAMQFTGHSLPVHQSDCTMGFYLVPYCQPSPPTPMEYATSASLEWHVWPGSKVNIQHISHIHIWLCNIVIDWIINLYREHQFMRKQEKCLTYNTLKEWIWGVTQNLVGQSSIYKKVIFIDERRQNEFKSFANVQKLQKGTLQKCFHLE